MITTIIAYSMFITNPSGTLGPHLVSRNAPYFFYEETQMREYKTVEECEAAAVTVRNNLAERADQLFKAANTMQKEAEYLSQRAKYQSLRCLSVERKIDTDYANTADGSKGFVAQKPTAVPLSTPIATKNDGSKDIVTVYRVGRFDTDSVFHGTAYNTASYASKDACEAAYRRTESTVAVKAAKDGVDVDGAVAILDEFKAKYGCHQILVDSSEMKAQPAQKVTASSAVDELPPLLAPLVGLAPTTASAASQVAAPPSPLPTAPVVTGATVPAPVTTPPSWKTPPSLSVTPILRFFISELVMQPNGAYGRVLHDGGFTSARMCATAIEALLRMDADGAKNQYRMRPSPWAYQVMNIQLSEIARRRDLLTCVN